MKVYFKQPWMVVLAGMTLLYALTFMGWVPAGIEKSAFITGSAIAMMFLGSAATAMKEDAPASATVMFGCALLTGLMMMFSLDVSQFTDSVFEGVAAGIAGLIGGVFNAAQDRANRARLEDKGPQNNHPDH